MTLLGFDALQLICMFLSEGETYAFLTSSRVLLHGAPSMVRRGAVRIERFHCVLEKFIKLADYVAETPPLAETLPTPPLGQGRIRRAPVRLYDEWEGARLLRLQQPRPMAPHENHERHPNPNASKLNTRAKGRRYPRRNVCPPKRFCVLHGASTRESRTRKRAWRFRLPTPSPTVSDSDDGATSASSTIQLLPTVARLTAVQLDKGTTSAHQSAAILQRILEQRVSIARHAYEMCVPEVMESVSGFMLRSGQGGMQRSRAWCGTPPILGVVNMVGTRNFTCYKGAL